MEINCKYYSNVPPSAQLYFSGEFSEYIGNSVNNTYISPGVLMLCRGCGCQNHSKCLCWGLALDTRTCLLQRMGATLGMPPKLLAKMPGHWAGGDTELEGEQETQVQRMPCWAEKVQRLLH